MLGKSIQQTFQDTGIVGDHVSLHGKIVAGRDIIMQNLSQLHFRFTDLDLTPYKYEDYPRPLFSQEVINIILVKRIIIVSGNYEFDKNSFIRYIASCLDEKVENIGVKEWVDRSENYSIYSAMIEEKKPCIFVFPQMRPQYINYELVRFIRLAKTQNHYILISSELSIESWKLTSTIESDFWYEIPSDKIYDDKTLENKLVKEVSKDLSYLFPQGTDSIHSQTFFTPKYTISKVALKLNTINRIDFFVRSIAQDSREISDDLIQEKIEKATNPSERLMIQWYNTLSSREKEIVIALSIFDGAYDDQLFSAIKRLVSKVWKERNTQLKSIDYSDLYTLLNFFSIDGIDEYKKIVSSRFDNQRINFFKSIWFSQRRHLLAALPVLSEIIHDSVNRHSNLELYGSKERITKIQNVVSSTLSDIGIINLLAVENILLELAANEEIRIQEITAISLARWKELGKEDQLYRTISKWQRESKYRELVKKSLSEEREKDKERKITPEAYIRATVALTIGYASQFDKPNDLSSQLLKIFNNLITDTNEFVQERFRRITLPQITENHFLQIKEKLFELTRKEDYINSIVLGLSNAYNKYPNWIKCLLDEWIEYSIINKSQRTYPNEDITDRDKVLLTTILVLGEIRYNNEFDFNAPVAYKIIENLQKEEYHYPVEEFYLNFIKRQIKIHFSDIHLEILRVIELFLKYNESTNLIDFFVEVYIEQRMNLEDGEEYIEFQGKRMAVWIDETRPLTHIEKTLKKWLLEDSRIGRQLAMDAFYQFAVHLEYFELQEIDRIKAEQNTHQGITERETFYQFRDERISPVKPDLLSKIIGYISLRGIYILYKAMLKSIIPILVKNKLTSKEHLSIVGEKLEQDTQPEFKILARYLAKFGSLYATLKEFKGLVFWILLIIVILILLGRYT